MFSAVSFDVKISYKCFGNSFIWNKHSKLLRVPSSQIKFFLSTCSITFGNYTFVTYKYKHHKTPHKEDTMASKVIQLATLVVVIVSITFIESMPMNGLSEIWTSGEIPKERPSSHEKVSSPEAEDVEILESPVTINKRSVLESKNEKTMLKTIVEDDNEKIISEEENVDDLETAAGTNVLRPLFVYRQQLAYRERVRKAGRRSAPNF